MSTFTPGSDTQRATIDLEEGETLYVDPGFVLSGQRGGSLVPPHPLRAPIGRWVNHRLRLHTLKHAPDLGVIELERGAPLANGAFLDIVLEPGESIFVDLKALVGFVLGPDEPDRRFLKPWFGGLKRLGYWIWGHPIPSVFTGPLRIILFAEALRRFEAVPGQTCHPAELVAFNDTSEILVKPAMATTRWSAITSSLVWDSRLQVEDGKNIVIRAVSSGGLLVRFFERGLVHVGVGTLLLFLSLWLHRTLFPGA